MKKEKQRNKVRINKKEKEGKTKKENKEGRKKRRIEREWHGEVKKS